MDEKRTLTFYKWVAFTFLLIHLATLFHVPSPGLAWTGYAWFTMLLVSVYYLVFHPGKMRFPYKFWLPWLLVLGGYWLFDLSYFGLQATLQYACFVLTGMAASKLTYTDEVMQTLFKWFKYLAYYVLIGRVAQQVLPVTFVGGMAAVAMTGCFFAAMGLSLVYVYGEKKYLWLYFVPLLIVAFEVTRMGCLMMLVVGAFHFANRKVAFKVSAAALVAVVGLIIFNSEGFQEKTFGKKGGELNQIEVKDGRMVNINNNGRDAMWNAMDKGIERSPVFGNGTRADLYVIRQINGFSECHCDYRAVAYDYGYFGLSCLVLGFLLTFLHLKSCHVDADDGMTQVPYYAALTLFLVWIGFMYSDNIMKYASQFGNLHFCLIAIAYGRLAYVKESVETTDIQ